MERRTQRACQCGRPGRAGRLRGSERRAVEPGFRRRCDGHGAQRACGPPAAPEGGVGADRQLLGALDATPKCQSTGVHRGQGGVDERLQELVAAAGQGRDSGQRRVAGQHRLRVVGRLGEVGGRRRQRSVPADGRYRRALRASRASAQGGIAARNGFGGRVFGVAAQFVHDRSERQCRWWLGLHLAGGARPNFGSPRGFERSVATVAECSTDRYTVCVQAARELPPELRGGRSMRTSDDLVADPGQDEAVIYEVTATGVAVMTLNRPDRLNTWGGDIATAFYAGLDRAEEDPAVRVIVLTGRGKAFCAGAQLGSMGNVAQSIEKTDSGTLASLIGDRQPYHLTTLCKPVIAAINGSCVGIGLTQALMCDVRFAAYGAKFAASFARRGLIAEYGASWILPRLIGWGAALDLLLSGRTFLADEAAQLGLVKEVVPPEQLMPRAMAYAEDIAQNCSPASIAVIKRQAYGDAMGEVADSSSRSEVLLQRSLQLPDVIEGITSFLEKRSPSFPGLSASAIATDESCGTGKDDHGNLGL